MAFTPFQLQNGTTLKNRIVKAAMEEMMVDVAKHNRPSPEMNKLYSAWSKGGAGLILSGHVMVDPLCMAAPADPWLADGMNAADEAAWKTYIDTAKSGGAQFYLQLNHPGRQQRSVGKALRAYAPSEVPLDLGALGVLFSKPTAMTEDDITRVINQFVWAAKKAEQLGADGIELHAAHGYLISQFLSPLSNIRTDKWGGGIENRARFLLEIVRAIRAAVSPSFGVSIKINSSDFQRGGFDSDDLHSTIKLLNSERLDFVELSGGTFEAPVMINGRAVEAEVKSASTIAREAYFLAAAKDVLSLAKMPIMVTGGIKTRATLDTVISSSPKVLAGVGMALGLCPDLPNRWQQGEDPAPSVKTTTMLPSKALKGAAKTSCVHYNMRAHSIGSGVWYAVWPTLAFLIDEFRGIKATIQYSSWVGQFSKAR